MKLLSKCIVARNEAFGYLPWGVNQFGSISAALEEKARKMTTCEPSEQRKQASNPLQP